MKYVDAVGKIFWGYFFLYINIYIGSVNILPPWIGFLLIYLALDGVAAMEPAAKLLKPFALLLVAEDLCQWGLEIFGATVDLYWINILVAVISLYFHFQLLTNLAEVAEGQGSQYAGKLKKLRSMQTVFLTIIALLPVGKETNLIFAENSVWVILFVLVNVIVLIFICITLFSYRKELQAMEGEAFVDGEG